jgi:hypothetical protein
VYEHQTTLGRMQGSVAWWPAVAFLTHACCAVLRGVPLPQGEIGGPQSVLSAMLNDVSPSTGDYVRLQNIYGQVMNLMIAGGGRGV